MSTTPLLVGDFGGTNARLAISTDGELSSIKEYKCASYTTPGSIFDAYVGGLEVKPETAVIAVASPADDPEAIIFTNGPWKQERRDFKHIGIPNVEVINDFAAICYSVAALKAEDCETLVRGNEPFFPSTVLNDPKTLNQIKSRMMVAEPKHRFIAIGPGTGLGLGSGFLTKDGQFGVLGGEGGHANFAPKTDLEMAVKKYLEEKADMQVTNETFGSGTGMKIVYNACAAVQGIDSQIEDASEITDLTNSHVRKIRETAFWTLRVFASTLGSSAQAVALANDAQTIFMGGGVVGKLGSYFDQTSFTEALRANDLQGNNILLKTPVMLVTHKYPGLLGAQAYHQLSL